MKSKITNLSILEMEDSNGHHISVQPEADDDNTIIDYILESGGFDIIFSDTNDIKEFGQALIDYAEQEAKK